MDWLLPEEVEGIHTDWLFPKEAVSKPLIEPCVATIWFPCSVE